MKYLRTMYLMLLILPFMVGCVLAKGAVDRPTSQTLCPVMGGKISKALFADYDGRRVYFCCKSCIDVFKNDPEKYVATMEEQGIALEKVTGASQGHGTGHSTHEEDTKSGAHGGCGCGS